MFCFNIFYICIKLGIIDKKLYDLKWFCNVRADMLREETCRLMKESGCHQVFMGFESGSDEMLTFMNKGCTIDQLLNGAELAKKYGIDRSVGFIIGLPHENEDTVKKTIELAKKVSPERLQFTRWTPLAGSPLASIDTDVVGFHNHKSDEIGNWIKQAYYQCQYTSNGKPINPSW